jgi:adenylate cyclase
VNSKPFQRLRQGWQTIVQPALHTGVAIVALVSVSVSLGVTGLERLGWLQAAELRIYDTMVRQRPSQSVDPRILVVGITEADLRFLQRSTPADETLAVAIARLQDYQPRAIGVDLYRDIPQGAGREQLLQQFEAPNVFAITKLGDSLTEAIDAPPGVPYEQVGFNDLLADPDGIVRRGLLFATAEDGVVHYAFALRLALAYLAEDGIRIAPSAIDPSIFQLNGTPFIPLEATDGGYQTIDTAGYQFLITYRGSQEVLRQVSLTDVLYRRVDPAWVTDAVVLIGTTAPSGKDLFQTPYSATLTLNHLMPGVLVHSHMVSQLLSVALDGDRLLRFIPRWAAYGILLGWSLIGGTVAWQVRQPAILGLATLALIGIVPMVGYSVFVGDRCWIPVAAPTLSLALTMTAVTASRAHETQRQQRMVMMLLGQSTSPEIAAALWRNRDSLLEAGKLPGQTLTATILFSDIQRFSHIAESQTPDRLLLWLNEYLDEMTQSIQQYQGIVNKFTGDGLMAVFGVPVARTSEVAIAQDAEHAVRCALDMSDRLAQLNQQWQAQGLPELHIRIGIYTGKIIAGSLGGKTRLEYGVIGDSVNIASRLESCCKERHPGICRILTTAETCQYITGKFDLEDWGPMVLRGREGSVQVYRVTGLMAGEDRSSLSACQPSPPISSTYTKTDPDPLKH